MARKLWWRLEWALWQKLVPNDIHRWLAYLMAWTLHRTKGSEVSEYWTWSMTPYPAGFPFLCQYWNGIRMTFSGKKGIAKVIKENEDDIDRQLTEIRKFDPEPFQEEPYHMGGV